MEMCYLPRLGKHVRPRAVHEAFSFLANSESEVGTSYALDASERRYETSKVRYVVKGEARELEVPDAATVSAIARERRAVERQPRPAVSQRAANEFELPRTQIWESGDDVQRNDVEQGGILDTAPVIAG